MDHRLARNSLVPGARPVEEMWTEEEWLCVEWAVRGWPEGDGKRSHVHSLKSIKIDLRREGGFGDRTE